MPIWPGDPAVVFTNVATFPNDGYFLRNFSMGEHSATHMNAPNSFHADGEDMIAFEREVPCAGHGLCVGSRESERYKQCKRTAEFHHGSKLREGG